MVALHHWNPEVKHAILLFCPFYFRMAMRASREIAIISARTFAAAYFPYLSFFLYLGLIPTRIISQLLALTPAVLFILFAGLSPRGMTVFFGSFLLSIFGLSEVFIASMTFLEIWLPSVVICCPRPSANFSKQFPISVASGSWTGVVQWSHLFSMFHCFNY